MPTFTRAVDLAFPRERVWEWHLGPGALTRLTPPFEPVEVVATEGVRNAAEVVLRARVAPGIDSFWTMQHHDVVPPETFSDRMLRGPFERWEHLHRFESLGPAATRASDEIAWTLPFGPVGAVADGVVRRRLARMFAYRHTTLATDLAEHARAQGVRLRIAITGARGFLGSQLAAFLTTGGHTVTRLVRGGPGEGELRWDPSGSWDAAPLDGYDGVIHLAGESIADGRWTPERKNRIARSRVEGTRALTTALARLPHPPRCFISASAMGIYGDRGDELLTERSSLGTDFLARIAKEWEEGAAPLVAKGGRTVQLRFGVLLSPQGGALAQMLPPFLAGVGGRLGNGKQWMSWLALDDAIYLIHRALIDARFSGPLNAAAPEPITNAGFTSILGTVLRRPTILPAPSPALKLLFGELAGATFLASQRLDPARLRELAFEWRYPTLEGALRHLLGRHPRESYPMET